MKYYLKKNRLFKMEENLKVVTVHENPDFIEDCCNLLNQEWPRSHTARMHSLLCSKDKLPTCLILLDNKKVIGHCKLTPIPSMKEACFVEAVVIDKGLRGKGYGSYLMTKAEEYCRTKLSLNTIYLSTKDKQNFYSRLGYSECEAVTIYGSPLVSNSKLSPKLNQIKTVQKNEEKMKACSPPCPPSLPNKSFTTVSPKKVYMKKTIGGIS